MSEVVFITGISSGFGKHIASFLAQKGFTVYGTCRKKCEHHPHVHVFELDVNDKEAIRLAVQDIVNAEGKIDILINNAGMHVGGPSEVVPDEDILLIMQTNFIGFVNTIKAVLPVMKVKKSGLILNFSSIGGLMGLPFQGYYSASKFAVEGFSSALRMELRPFNIKVVVINPGDFHTKNTLNRRNYFINGQIADYEQQFRDSLRIIESDERGGWDPQKMARKIYKIIISNNKSYRYVIASFEQKLAVLLKRILPDALFDAILRSHYGIK